MEAVSEAVLHQQLDYLEGEVDLLEKVRPVMEALVQDLAQLPPSSYGEGALPAFQRCIEHLNRYEDYIETVERESFLDVIYRLGELVGLSVSSQFAEEWRGDW